MIENNKITKIISIALISIVVLALPIMTTITSYINPEALKGFHFSFLFLILLAYIFILLFRTKLFFLPMISFIGVASIWFVFYSITQGITNIIPSFAFVITISVINIAINIPYVINLVKESYI